jgi:thiol-disulfide isomerase/thioredoxin
MRLACFFIFFPLLSLAQQNPLSSKPLNYPALQPVTIGDNLPASAFNPKLKTPNTQLLILDFFATWCGSCIHSLRKTDSLQQQFGSQLQLLLVSSTNTGDDEKKISAFFQKYRKANGRPYAFSTLINDTLLTKLFPHKTVPHYVWVNRQGKVVAITSSAELTAANIQKALKEGELNLPLKNDFPDYTPSLPLLQNGNGGTAAGLRYGAILTSPLPSLGPGTRTWSDSTLTRTVWLNQPLINLYHAALGFMPNRIVLENCDTALLFKSPSGQNIWCADITLPGSASRAQTKNGLLNLLNGYFSLNGRMEIRSMPCWLLVKTAGGPPPSQSPPFTQWYSAEHPATIIKNQPLSKLLNAFNTQLLGLPFKPIVLDETGITHNIDIELTAPLTDIPQVKKQLRIYGLDLVPAHRQLEVFILTGNGNKNINQSNNNDQ